MDPSELQTVYWSFHFKDDIDQIKERMIKLDHIYLLYKEERSYLKKTTYVKSRKLVLFRQAIMTSNRALYLLKKLHKLENEILWCQSISRKA